MEVIHERCAGIDVHKDVVVVCVRIATGGRARCEVRSFGTTTSQLLALGDWLGSESVTHVAMESTGVYWKPVWHMLDGLFELTLGNATHIRNVPGRKSDVNDATWIADLLAHGLIRGSFVPPVEIQELRDLTRTRKELTREVTQHVQRLQSVLQDCNIKLDSVASSVMGKSGRAMLDALVEGKTDPVELAELALGALRKKHDQLVEALRGKVLPHHSFLLKLHLDQIDALQRGIAELEAKIEEMLRPFADAVAHLMTMPGVGDTAAHVLVAEIGLDMKRFPTAGHLVSWAGLCPRMDESAGKRRSTRLRKGGNWIKTTLVQCAWAAVRAKGTYLQGQFLRLKARRGPRKAIMAVAASMLTSAYHMLRDDEPYREPDPTQLDERERRRAAKRLLSRLGELGYAIQLPEFS